ncbi:MAG: hypothetical protein R8L53_06750 [Mariprofundales bacterium]
MLAVIFILGIVNMPKSIGAKLKLIEDYHFPDKIFTQLQQKYPHLDESEIDQIINGLRAYFSICAMAQSNFVSMPSKAVDEAWHEFILFTKNYNQFCNEIFGHFLHHIPAEAMTTKTQAQKGIKIAWKLSCERENINVFDPEKLPILFAIDTMLNIGDGFYYTTDFADKNKYYASNIGCSGMLLASSGSSDSDASDGGASDGGASCGSGCGGGCGGG